MEPTLKRENTLQTTEKNISDNTPALYKTMYVFENIIELEQAAEIKNELIKSYTTCVLKDMEMNLELQKENNTHNLEQQKINLEFQKEYNKHTLEIEKISLEFKKNNLTRVQELFVFDRNV